MAFDFKKEYREFYMPGGKPEIVSVPPAHYIAVRGAGDPNEPDGAYQRAIGLLYGLAFTIKMSPRAGHAMDGFFDYVVPPLEGFWWQEGVDGMNYSDKNAMRWVSVIRLPDFVTEAEFAWAVAEATRKKKADFSGVEYLAVDEGLCVQCMHTGAFDDEPATVALMDDFIARNGCVNDFSDVRMHHEIYLSDARRVPPEKRKTVVRHPVRRL